MHFHYEISGTDFTAAGNASAEMKKILQRLGLPTPVIKRTAVAMYESEINMVVHAGGGQANIDITDTEIIIKMSDKGPGIANLEQALTEGFSTAPEVARELGFGAGMGLPNMKRSSDEMTIDTALGKGTTVTMRIMLQ